MKTYTIENQYSPASGRILAVRLVRYGKCYASQRIINNEEAVPASWAMRTKAKELGATHVRYADTGAHEPIDA